MVPDNEHTNFFFFFEQRYKYLSSWLTNKSFSQRNAHDIVLRQPKISISSYQSLVIESINEHGNIRINICLWLFQIERKKDILIAFISWCAQARMLTHIFQLKSGLTIYDKINAMVQNTVIDFHWFIGIDWDSNVMGVLATNACRCWIGKWKCCDIVNVGHVIDFICMCGWEGD